MTEPLVVPPSAQAVAVAVVDIGLSALFDQDVFVASKVPDRRRPYMVRVTRTPGGGLINAGATDLVRLLIEGWGPDDVATERLMNVTRAVLGRCAGTVVAGVFVRHWQEDGGPYSWPDESKQGRWQMTGEMRIKISPG